MQVFPVTRVKSVPFDAADIAVAFPFKTPVIVVERVRAGVEPPEEEPANPFAEAIETAVTDPDAPPMHVPPIEKHPPVRLNPTFDVEVAEPFIFRPESVVVPNPEFDTLK